MAANRRSTRASAIEIAPTHPISGRHYGQVWGVSIAPNVADGSFTSLPGREKIGLCPLYSVSDHFGRGADWSLSANRAFAATQKSRETFRRLPRTTLWDSMPGAVAIRFAPKATVQGMNPNCREVL